MEFIIREDPRFFDLDTHGYIVPPITDKSKISLINQFVLEEVIRYVRMVLTDKLIAIFFRGSQLIDAQTSDFDTIVVCREQEEWTSAKLSYQLNTTFQDRFFHISNFDTLVISDKELKEDRKLQFNIKVLSLRVYGEPVNQAFAEFKPDTNIMFHLKGLDKKLAVVLDFIKHSSRKDGQNVAARNHLIKYLLRAAFELTIPEEKKFTRDISLCSEVFSKHYPQYKELAARLLANVNNSVTSNDLFISMTQQFAASLAIAYSQFQNNPL